jgi:hypothetical protein
MSLILIFVLLLILVCSLKQKQNHTETVYRDYMLNTDLNNNVGKIVINGWFSSILVKDRETLFQMIHPKAQINTYMGMQNNALKSLHLITQIDLLPNYKIRRYQSTLTNNNMIISHELYQAENNDRFNSMFTFAKDSYLKWKVISWSFYKV